MRALGLALIVVGLSSGCLRTRRVLAPERFVTPAAEVGEQSLVVVSTGWTGEEPVLYEPPTAFEQDGERWVEPVAVTDWGFIEVTALDPEAVMRVRARPTGYRKDGFSDVVALQGTLDGRLDSAIHFVGGPLGEEAVRLYVADLQNIYRGRPLQEGDLLLVEVGKPGTTPERYLFRNRRFGWRGRLGAGVLVRTPLDAFGETISPALTGSLSVGYRPRTRSRALEFPTERLALIGSVGVGSSVLVSTGDLDEQLEGAIASLVAGGGVEVFELASVQILGDQAGTWTLALGVDAVQLGRALSGAIPRLLSDHPVQESR